MKTQKYTVSKTYAEVTPESAENGDFSDHGFVFENQKYTLKELIHEVKNSSYFFVQRNSDTNLQLVDQEAHVTDYGTATERTEDFHIAGDKEAIDALELALKR